VKEKKNLVLGHTQPRGSVRGRRRFKSRFSVILKELGGGGGGLGGRGGQNKKGADKTALFERIKDSSPRAVIACKKLITHFYSVYPKGSSGGGSGNTKTKKKKGQQKKKSKKKAEFKWGGGGVTSEKSKKNTRKPKPKKKKRKNMLCGFFNYAFHTSISDTADEKGQHTFLSSSL